MNHVFFSQIVNWFFWVAWCVWWYRSEEEHKSLLSWQRSRFFWCKSSSGQSYAKLNALAGLGGLNLSKGAMRRVGSNGECFENSESQWPVHAALLVAQLLSGGYYVIIKMALVNEMNLIVLSVYRDLLALVFLIPAAWLIERLVFLSIPLFKVVLSCLLACLQQVECIMIQ